MNRVTVLDVADLAGVSALSVVRVANGEPNVRADTRRKVRAALAQLNYQVTPATRRAAERGACING
ncbi:MAG: LacI family DNA-binding transcriptional regulator [Pseudomonadota bacterium]